MIKDTFFSWSRFQLLLKKTFRENWKTFGLRILLIFGLLTIGMVWYGYFAYSSFTPKEEIASFNSYFFLWMFCISGATGASFIMEELKNKTKRISFLMTPATSFEKFFTKWFIYVIGYLLVFIIVFRIADAINVILYSLIYPSNTNISLYSFSSLLSLSLNNKVAIIYNWTMLFSGLSAYLCGQSLFILGGVLWPKNSFIKTFAAVLILFIIFVFSFVYSLKNTFEGFPSAVSMPYFSPWYTIIGFINITLFCWILAYYRFKEIEIINRM